MCSRWLLLPTLAGCGSLVDASWLGEPLLSLEGTVYAEALGSLDEESLRVALFWSSTSGAETEQVVVATTSFPARYRLDLFEPPPGRSAGDAPHPPDEGDNEFWLVGVDVGRPLLYADLDKDGMWSPEYDPIVGGSADVVILYVDATLADMDRVQAYVHPEVEMGFQRMVSRESCDGAGETQLLSPGDGPTDLLLGNVWSYQWAAECFSADVGGDEFDPSWVDEGFVDPMSGEQCPEPYAMVYFCQEQAAYESDPSMARCLEPWCPVLDHLREVRELLSTCPIGDEMSYFCTQGPDAQREWQANCVEILCPVYEVLPWLDLSQCPPEEEMFAICIMGTESADPLLEACQQVYCR